MVISVYIREMVISPILPIMFKESLDGLFKEVFYRKGRDGDDGDSTQAI